MTVELNCSNCGAPLESDVPVCVYCNTPVKPDAVNLTVEEELVVLRKYHTLLRNLDEKAAGDAVAQDQLVRVLKTGFLPRQAEVLIDAGLKLIPFLGLHKFNTIDEAAYGRLEMIRRKLKILTSEDDSPKLKTAIKQFDVALSQYIEKKDNREGGMVAIGCGVVLLLGLVALTYILFFAPI